MEEIKKEEETNLPVSCKHFLKRKKRLCRMLPSKNRDFCAEHDLEIKNEVESGRIPCPLDPKHTVFANKLNKHLKICNAKPKLDNPDYILNDVNLGSDEDLDPEDYKEIKLSEIDDVLYNQFIEKVNKFYSIISHEKVRELILEHEVLKDEIKNNSTNNNMLKHLTQIGSIIGSLEYFKMLKADTCYIELGAGRGQVSYWLAKATENLINCNIVLVDRGSQRHKLDNKLTENSSISRIRADIKDLVLGKLDCRNQIQSCIAVGKHLCGAATDLSLRCIVKGNSSASNHSTKGFSIALCCHHKCDWRPYVGKKFLLENGFNKNYFNILCRMSSWAVCGTGQSRERRAEIAAGTYNADVDKNTNSIKLRLSLEERQEIGRKCKRIIDFGRTKYLEENGYKSDMISYIKSDVTLENVCLIGKSIS